MLNQKEVQKKKDSLYDTVESFLNSVDITDVNDLLVQVLLDGIESGDKSPNDTGRIHTMHMFMQDIQKIME